LLDLQTFAAVDLNVPETDLLDSALIGQHLQL